MGQRLIDRFHIAARDGHRVKAEGALARTILHEIDHLDGIVYTTKAEEFFDEEDD